MGDMILYYVLSVLCVGLADNRLVGASERTCCASEN